MRGPRLLAIAMAAPLLGVGTSEAAMRHRPPAEAPAPLAKPEPLFPVDTGWTLAQMNGKPVPGEAPSFSLDDKYRATGFSGCNTYSMTLYPVRNQKLAAGAIATTRKQCDRAEMLFEHAFLVGLHSLPAWRLDGDDLVLTAPAATMRFRRGL